MPPPVPAGVLRSAAPVLAAALGACGPGAAPPPPTDAPNLLLVTVDTLRADELGCYGAEPSSTPRIDAFAKSAVVFHDAQAPSSWTLPSFTSLMTSLAPTTHGNVLHDSRLDASYETLAERLLAAGWDTAAVLSHVFLGRPYGLDQGFVHYDDERVLELNESHRAISSPSVTDEALAFLRNHASSPDRRPWFLWLHYFDPHEEYRAHEGYTVQASESSEASEASETSETSETSGASGAGGASDGASEHADARRLYRGEIAFTDHHVGRVLDELDALGLVDETVVVFTADHGEEFGEHGGTSHAHTLHVELLRLPLLVRAPGTAPGRVRATVRTLDVAPTILELLDLPPSPHHTGESLVPALRGVELEPRRAVAELEKVARKRMVSLVDGRWKLIVRRGDEERVELYDRAADPGEQRDVAAEHPDEVRRLRAALSAELDAAADSARLYTRARNETLGVVEESELEKLGYLHGDDRDE